tara:strand:- start:4684 stop:5310 length:627 start_codon:yes stop_codon:yes gene_type:complete
MKNCIEYCNGSFGIQGLTRLKQDKCYLEKHNVEITKPGIYHTRNLHDCHCEAPFTKNLSLQQPSTFYRDGFGWTSNDGCNIDNDSSIRNSHNLTNTREIHQLRERMFLTVPYMGRGEGNSCIESVLRPGEDTMQQKSTNSLSGAFIDRYTPQLPCIRDNVQNPDNIIPENSDPAWLRGGQPSRQIIRNKDYLQKCGFSYTGKYWAKSN